MRTPTTLALGCVATLLGCGHANAPASAPARATPVTAAKAPEPVGPPPSPLRWTLHGEGAEPRAQLRYRPGVDGFSCAFTTENHTETSMLVGPKVAKGRHVVDVRRDARAGRLVASLASYAIDGAPAAMADVYRAAGAPSMTFELDARGELRDVRFAPYAPLTKDHPAIVALEKARDASEPLDLAELDRLLGPLRRQMEQTLRSSVESIWPPLPEAPVGVGASWTVTREWSSPGVMEGSSRKNERRRTYELKPQPDGSVILEHTTSTVTHETGPEATSDSKARATGRTTLRLGEPTALATDDVLDETGASTGTLTFEDFDGAKKTKPFTATTRGRLQMTCK